MWACNTQTLVQVQLLMNSSSYQATRDFVRAMGRLSYLKRAATEDAEAARLGGSLTTMVQWFDSEDVLLKSLLNVASLTREEAVAVLKLGELSTVEQCCRLASTPVNCSPVVSFFTGETAGSGKWAPRLRRR